MPHDHAPTHAAPADLVRGGADADAFLDHVTDEPEHDFAIARATVQLERTACVRAGACLATCLATRPDA